jgi:stearoyl-CoA desaturase (Delta-9 desaturase)
MKTKVWQRSIAAWAFFPVAYLSYLLGAEAYWWMASFVLYLVIALTVTVGYHRLFTHNAFETSRFWHWFFGIVGCVSLNSAPMHWSVVHMNHHRYSDTEKDPYDSNLKHFFRFYERTNLQVSKNEVRMMKDFMHQFLVNHSLTLALIFAAITAGFGIKAFLFLWALPTTTYLVTAGLHTIFAHEGRLDEHSDKTSSARNLWLLEFIIPMGGEWLHREHHEKPKLMNWATRPYYYDMGAQLIKLIGKNAKPST